MTKLTSLAAGATSSHFNIALGDLPTWALFVGAFAAALIALRQLRIQQDDSARQTRQLERQQANYVDFSWWPAADVMILTNPPGPVTTAGRTVAVVENKSRRPISNVTCWIELEKPPRRLDAIMVGPIGEPSDPGFQYNLHNPRPGKGHPLIRPGAKYGFLFEFELPKNDVIMIEPQTERTVLQFIDDADLTWQIDDNLRLERIKPPARRWRDLLSP